MKKGDSKKKRFLRRKEKMAKTLEEVMADFASTKADVKRIKSEHTEKRKKMSSEKIKSRLTKATKDRENAQKTYEQLEALVNSPALDAADKAKYGVQRDDAKQALDEAKRVEQELLDKKAEYEITTADMAGLQRAEQKMQDVVDFFVSNPEINEYLQSKLKYEYKQKIEKYNGLIQESNDRFDNVSTALQSPDLQGEVEEMKRAYEEYQRVQSATPSTISIKSIRMAAEAYEKAIENLNKKLYDKGVLSGVELTQADYDSIGTGIFELPSKAEEATRIGKQKTEMEARRDKILVELEGKKVISTGFATIPQDLQAKIVANNTEIAANDQALQQAEDELNAIVDHESRLEELHKKISGEGTQDKAVYDAARRRYINAAVKLMNAGYIDKNIIPDLKDPNSEISKKYETYKTANKEFRQAMLEYQANPSDENKKKLQEKINAYKNISAELESDTTMKPDAWNRYYLEQIKREAEKNGTDIDPIFLEDTAMNRAIDVQNQYKRAEGTKENDAFLDSVEILSKDQESILNGDEVKDFEKHLDTHKSAVKGLADYLKINVSEISTIMKQQVMKKISRIGNFFRKLFKRDNAQRTPTIKYKSGFDPDGKDFADVGEARVAYAKYKDAEKAYKSYQKAQLTDKEQQELKDLEEEAKKKSEVAEKVKDLRDKKKQLNNEKAVLDHQVASLPPVTTAPEISDASDIMHTKGTAGIVGEARKNIEREIDGR